ncbi:MAG: NADPH-dependent FMN reductase [Bacillota bacterium]
MNIGIILGSTREGRVSEQVGKWVLEHAQKRDDANYELIDLRDYKLPFLGETLENNDLAAWNDKIASLDSFIFIVPEYNHALTGVLKNAFDSAKRELWANKAAGLVSYGSAYGARAAENIRLISGELQIADVRTQVLLSLFLDFENYSKFKPQDLHQNNLNDMLNQVIAWGSALKSLR